jgi:hypothetical protein
LEGSAVSASHLPDYCQENGLEIPLPEGTEIPVDARVFVLYQGQRTGQPDLCPLSALVAQAERQSRKGIHGGNPVLRHHH